MLRRGPPLRPAACTLSGALCLRNTDAERFPSSGATVPCDHPAPLGARSIRGLKPLASHRLCTWADVYAAALCTHHPDRLNSRRRTGKQPPTTSNFKRFVKKTVVYAATVRPHPRLPALAALARVRRAVHCSSTGPDFIHRCRGRTVVCAMRVPVARAQHSRCVQRRPLHRVEGSRYLAYFALSAAPERGGKDQVPRSEPWRGGMRPF
jgi:hypothetical protein